MIGRFLSKNDFVILVLLLVVLLVLLLLLLLLLIVFLLLLDLVERGGRSPVLPLPTSRGRDTLSSLTGRGDASDEDGAEDDEDTVEEDKPADEEARKNSPT